MTMGTYSRRNLRRVRGVGDCTADNTDELGICVTGVTDSVGTPLPSSSLPVIGTSCYPTNFVGPLPAGAAYCAQPGTTGQAGCPTGSTCSVFAGVPDTAVYTLAALLAGFVIYGVAK